MTQDLKPGAKVAFISHSTKNKSTADNIVLALEKNGISCWIAPRDINAGINYGAAIANGISDCQVFVLISSQESIASAAVVREVQLAFECHKHIIPLRIDKTPATPDFQFFLSGVQWLDATPDQTEFDRLVGDISLLLNMPAKPVFEETVLLNAMEEDEGLTMLLEPENSLTLHNADNPNQSWRVNLVSDVIIGRNPGCDVCLPEPSVSREQCKVYMQGGEMILENLSRSNITQLNDRPLRGAAPLSLGDKILCGRIMLVVSC